MLEVTCRDKSAATSQLLTDAITTVHTRIVALLKARGQAKERFASLRNRAKTQAAHDLIEHVRVLLEDLEQSKRTNKRRAASRAKLVNAIERLVSDLLSARAGMDVPALLFRPIGKSSFDHTPVKYETFTNVLNGLKALELIGHQKGQTRYRKIEFDPGDFVSTSLPGRASRFWATSKLLRLADQVSHSMSAVHQALPASEKPPPNTGRKRRAEA